MWVVEKSQIRLNDIRIYAYHGVIEQERKVGGWYLLTVSVDYPFTEAMHSDDVTHTLNYASLLDIVKEQMAVPSRLLEHVASRIADSIAQRFPLTIRIEVAITKETPPLRANTRGATVTLCLKNDKYDGKV